MADSDRPVSAQAESPGDYEDGFFRAMIERSPYLYCVVDGDLNFTYVSPASRDLLGYEPRELIGRPALDIVYPDDIDTAISAFTQVVDEFDPGHREGIPMAFRLLCRDGTPTYIEAGAAPAFDVPAVNGVILRGRPIDGQQLLDQAFEALVASSPLEEVLAYLVTSVEHELKSAHVLIGESWSTDRFAAVVQSESSTMPTTVAVPGEDLSPWARAIATGAPCFAADPSELPPSLQEQVKELGLEACWAVPVNVPPDDAMLACIVVWRDLPGTPFVSHLASLDRARRLTALAFERQHTEGLLRHAALHDPLTRLPNRAQFFQRLEAEMAAGSLAVLYLDLDGFKPINDTHGHGAGDELLRIVSARITAAVRPGDLVARLGGDEFAVLCSVISDSSEATAIAERLVTAVARPIKLAGGTVEIGVSVGIALGARRRDAHDNGERLLEAADAALYEAKHAGRGRWHLASS